MTSNSQVLADLQAMHKDGQEVSLLNVFKGVPVTCTAGIQTVHEDRAVLRVNPPESTSLVWERYTWMQGPRFLEAVKARVVRFDIASDIVELDGFQYAGSRLGERSSVRVEPRDTLRVSVETPSQSIVGTIADLSTVGVGVYIYPLENEHPFRRAEEVRLVMRLPGQEVSIRGKMRALLRQGDYFRVSFNFLPEQPESAAIAAYIVTRREEILEELPRLYEELRRSKAGENQVDA